MISTSIISQKIAENHYQEWKNSGVNDEIIFNNVTTIYDKLEVDKLLNIRTKRMWNRPDDLVPCWAVSGVDPIDDTPTIQGVQVKPNNPYKDSTGRIVKYLTAKNSETSPLFLDNGSGYWQSKINNIFEPIIITEGAKKAGSLLSNDYCAVSIPGVATCRKKGRLHQNLELFAKVGRRFYLCFDNDILYKEPVQKALIGLARELSANGSKVCIIQLPEGDAKGVDDYLVAYGRDNFQSLLDNAATFEEWLEEIKNSESEAEETQLKSRLAKHFQLIEKQWGIHLRYNNLKKQIELYGRELDEDEVRLVMALQFDIDISSADAQMIIKALAKRDEYSPIVEYLDEINFKFPDIDTSFLDNLARDYFGSDDPLHAIYFKKFLVSAVARARNPGCKVDSVLMLLSPEQGKYKSTFFDVLFGDGFFSDQLGSDISNKDEKMKISKYWCLEWSEFEAIYKKKDVASLKSFITNKSDCFRAPYARKEAEHPRPCVFVGTSNEREILHDPTGDRRFWIIPVTVEKIPLDKVRADRDRLWAAADALYKSGFKWWLDDKEDKVRQELNKEFRATTFWDEMLENLWEKLGRPNFISTETIVKELGFTDAKEIRGGVQKELSDTMTRLGFSKIKNARRINGELRRGWEKIKDQPVEDFSENLTVTDELTVTPALYKDSSRYTTVTDDSNSRNTVTEQNLETVTVLQSNDGSVTGLHQLEPIQIATVTVKTDVTVNPEDFSQEENLAELQVNVELFRMALADNSYEMITQLVESWSQDFKKSVFAMLTPEEQEQARKLRDKNQSPPPEEIVKKMASEILGETREAIAHDSSTRMPLLKEGRNYFSKTHKRKIKVFTLFDSIREVSCSMEGIRGRYSVGYGDIVACDDSPTASFEEGEEVILVGKNKKRAIVTTVTDEGIYLKDANTGKSLRKMFYAHQVEEV